MHVISWWFDEMWKWIRNTDVVFHIHSVVIVMNVHEISRKFHWRGRNSWLFDYSNFFRVRLLCDYDLSVELAESFSGFFFYWLAFKSAVNFFPSHRHCSTAAIEPHRRSLVVHSRNQLVSNISVFYEIFFLLFHVKVNICFWNKSSWSWWKEWFNWICLRLFHDLPLCIVLLKQMSKRWILGHLFQKIADAWYGSSDFHSEYVTKRFDNWHIKPLVVNCCLSINIYFNQTNEFFFNPKQSLIFSNNNCVTKTNFIYLPFAKYPFNHSANFWIW